MLERIAFEYRKDEPFRVVKDGCIGTIRTMEGGGVSKYIMEIERLGNIFGEDKGTGYAGNVWNKSKLCPTLQTMQGGYREPMIIEEIKKYGNKNGNYVPYDGAACYPLHSQDFIRTGFQDISYTLSARDYKDPKCVIVKGGTEMIDEVKELGFMDNGKENDVASTILSGYERSNMTGFNADNGVLEYKAIDEQNMCVRDDTFGTLTTDGSSPKHNNRVMECVETQYRIRKLTPRECYRLMAVPEESIDKMLEVNSNTQCYKQAGNSIVVNCLVAIFSQMGIQGIPRWNEGLSEKYK